MVQEEGEESIKVQEEGDEVRRVQEASEERAGGPGGVYEMRKVSEEDRESSRVQVQD